MKKSDLIKGNIENLREEAKKLVNKTDATIEELEAIDNKIAAEEKKLEVQLKLEAKERTAASAEGTTIPTPTPSTTDVTDEEKQKIMAKALVGKASTEELGKISNLLQEGEDGKGGLLVPADVRTKIIELQRKKFDIRKFINVEKTKVDKGSRPKEKNEPEASGFASVDEGKDIQALYEPEIENVEYAIRKYSGYIPVTNELLEDSPENIMAFVERWMAKNELNTYAYQVFNGTGAKSAEGILNALDGKLVTRVVKLAKAPTLKDFKDAFNIHLEDITEDNINIFTNGTGYSHIDGMEDALGRPLLQPDATKETGNSFLGKGVVKVPTKFLKQVVIEGVTYTPYIIGNLELLYTMYDRDALVVESTKIGGQAWRTGTTEIKGTFRFDGKINGDIKSVYIILANQEAAQASQSYSRANNEVGITLALKEVVKDNRQAMEKLTETLVNVLDANKEVAPEVAEEAPTKNAGK